MSISFVLEKAAPLTVTRTTQGFLEDFKYYWIFPDPNRIPHHQTREELYLYLAKQNLRQIQEYLPEVLFGKVLNRSLTSSESFTAASYIEYATFHTTYDDFPNIGSLLQNRRLSEVEHLNHINLERIVSSKRRYVDRLLQWGIAALLVRPEIFHLRDLVSTFLIENGFDVIHRSEKSIDFTHYWALYKHAFSDPVKESHVRRRAFGYIDRPTELVLFTDPKNRYGSDAMRLADGIKRDYKGIAGAYEPSTLRGGIIHAEMSMAMINRNSVTEIALDPLLQYHYADPSVYNQKVRSHILANLPGVHIPEGHEIGKDLGVLLELDEIKNL